MRGVVAEVRDGQALPRRGRSGIRRRLYRGGNGAVRAPSPRARLGRGAAPPGNPRGPRQSPSRATGGTPVRGAWEDGNRSRDTGVPPVLGGWEKGNRES